jgi:tRNA-dihydrouridine synthase B
MNTLDTIDLQQAAINDFFAELKSKHERLVYIEEFEPEALAA